MVVYKYFKKISLSGLKCWNYALDSWVDFLSETQHVHILAWCISNLCMTNSIELMRNIWLIKWECIEIQSYPTIILSDSCNSFPHSNLPNTLSFGTGICKWIIIIDGVKVSNYQASAINKAKRRVHIVPVARLEAFMALKLYRLESFRALKSIGQIWGV